VSRRKWLLLATCVAFALVTCYSTLKRTNPPALRFLDRITIGMRLEEVDRIATESGWDGRCLSNGQSKVYYFSDATLLVETEKDGTVTVTQLLHAPSYLERMKGLFRSRPAPLPW
jgi:hypothetical protein